MRVKLAQSGPPSQTCSSIWAARSAKSVKSAGLMKSLQTLYKWYLCSPRKNPHQLFSIFVCDICTARLSLTRSLRMLPWRKPKGIGMLLDFWSKATGSIFHAARFASSLYCIKRIMYTTVHCNTCASLSRLPGRNYFALCGKMTYSWFFSSYVNTPNYIDNFEQCTAFDTDREAMLTLEILLSFPNLWQMMVRWRFVPKQTLPVRNINEFTTQKNLNIAILFVKIILG